MDQKGDFSYAGERTAGMAARSLTLSKAGCESKTLHALCMRQGGRTAPGSGSRRPSRRRCAG